MNGYLTSRGCYLYGAGGHSGVVEDALRANGYEIVGWFDDSPEKTNRSKPGIHLNESRTLVCVDAPVIIAIGRNDHRAYLSQRIDAVFMSITHPSAVVAPTVVVGDGTVILHGSVIQTKAKIGNFAIVNTGARIGHDAVVEDYVHISPGVILCGSVRVRQGAHVGAGAVVIPGITIGRWCSVGAGSVVIRDVPDYCTVVGNPARTVKYRTSRSDMGSSHHVGDEE